MCRVLSSCPCLGTVVIKDYLKENISIPSNRCFEQLHSLSIEGFSLIFESLEFFADSFPSLKHLKLIGGETVLDGQRWEELIQRKFLQLDRFEFFFRNDSTEEQLPPIISSFQRPFWMQSKQWFVSCRFNREKSTLDLHTIPICTSTFYLDENVSEELTSSTSSMMTYVTSLDLTMRSNADFEEKVSDRRYLVRY